MGDVVVRLTGAEYELVRSLLRDYQRDTQHLVRTPVLTGQAISALERGCRDVAPAGRAAGVTLTDVLSAELDREEPGGFLSDDERAAIEVARDIFATDYSADGHDDDVARTGVLDRLLQRDRAAPPSVCGCDLPLCAARRAGSC